MEYRQLGRTGLRVSEVGFGCGNVGGLIIRGSFEEQVAGVQRALELGINYFDTAASYGDGLSEEHLGNVLRELKPDVFVATKAGPRFEESLSIRDGVLKSAEESLKRLGRDYVDLLQLHSRIADTPARGSFTAEEVLRAGGVADAMEAARDAGLTRFVGITGLGDTDALHEVVASGRFDTVQCYYNLLNPSAGVAMRPGFYGQDFRRLADAAAQQNMGVVNIRLMAGGALGGESARQGYASRTMGGGMVPGAEYSDDEARAAQLSFLVKGEVQNMAQAAVGFGLANQHMSTVLVGYSDTAQIESAAACAGRGPTNADHLQRLQELWAGNFGGS